MQAAAEHRVNARVSRMHDVSRFTLHSWPHHGGVLDEPFASAAG
jgi:hypothetical protein